MRNLKPARTAIRSARRCPENEALSRLIAENPISSVIRENATARATALVESIRASGRPGLMEVFLAQYGLSSDEGVALMCLAEALLRVPDAETIDSLIEDKIAGSSWSEHLGQSSSPLVNASTWALLLTGKILDPEPQGGVVGVLRSATKRLGEPVIRTAVRQAMRELGRQFVLGRDIGEAMSRAAPMERDGYAYSYDMLGEAALTAADAQTFFDSYAGAIAAIGASCKAEEARLNPGVSVKLSALHPRYEVSQKERVLAELIPRVTDLALQARAYGMGFNIDAEEADRLELSLDVIAAVLSDPRLAGWDGFGVVVQAYSKRAAPVIEWLAALARNLDRRVMVRLVKGAYWDTEIKRAQVDGAPDYPVFERKAATDASYICCAAKLLSHTDRIYPQFATHNAHTVSMVLELAKAANISPERFEFQRLHGMGEALHAAIAQEEGALCRIYAPVGPHRDLLAYLVRRLLENGANSSFVNQIVDVSTPAAVVARDPFSKLETTESRVRKPADLFAPERRNSLGWDLTNETDLIAIEAARAPFEKASWTAEPLIVGAVKGESAAPVRNPASPEDRVGDVRESHPDDVEAALQAAAPWGASAEERQRVLNRAADLYEAHFGEIFAILCREAGKTPLDAVAELREAVDFLRYYGAQGELHANAPARGVIACISPWNFPLAIFSGQIAAALAAGNGVLAKPAEPTPIIAWRAVQLLHEAGVPRAALQLLPGRGSVVGAAITSDPRVAGVCFTGSTATAQRVNRAMADALAPDAPLIAETGGLNAMLVDSTALPEQAVKDIIASAFQSAGQRCSALRILYVQEDVAERFQTMLFGAIDELSIGDPWSFATDIGPVITETARADIASYIDEARRGGRLLKQSAPPETGIFIPPTVLSVGGIKDLPREIFGPVLHIATFKADEIDQVVADVNACGYGLTFGLHTRIDSRVETLTASVRAGNLYVNRNQIGAIVGSQPFGGEGLSGTGPKAGGPHYLPRFKASPGPREPFARTPVIGAEAAQAALDALEPPSTQRVGSALNLPGPTGESNRLQLFPRGRVLCLGPSAEAARAQAVAARAAGCPAVMIAPGVSEGLSGALDLAALETLTGFDAAALWAEPSELRTARRALARREGPLIPLLTEADISERCVLERHICVDTTAAGGDANLLAAVDEH